MTPAYDHVDFRVRNLRKVARFYDAFMRALGFSKVSRGRTCDSVLQAQERLRP